MRWLLRPGGIHLTASSRQHCCPSISNSARRTNCGKSCRLRPRMQSAAPHELQVAVALIALLAGVRTLSLCDKPLVDAAKCKSARPPR